jgi:REP element-mobilizing transposase RayT
MPRHARIDIPGLLHHVIVRGIEKRPVFLDDQDREEFLSRFTMLLAETKTDCYAWALLDTHFHLLLQPQTAKLSHFMRRLLTGYAVVFNLRHQRAGHLFQNRYKSIACDGDSYLLELVRYIHLNPLRAGIVDTLASLDDHPWCGHCVFRRNRPPDPKETVHPFRGKTTTFRSEATLGLSFYVKWTFWSMTTFSFASILLSS